MRGNMKAQAVAVIILVLFGASLSLAQESYVGIVKNVTGEVVVQRGDQTITAVPGMNLQVTDVLLSSSGSTGGIVFSDGTLLSIGPSSEIDLEQYIFEPSAEQYDFSLYIKKGRAVYSSGKIGKLAPEKIKVKTPRATLGVRGTTFIVDVD